MENEEPVVERKMSGFDLFCLIITLIILIGFGTIIVSKALQTVDSEPVVYYTVEDFLAKTESMREEYDSYVEKFHATNDREFMTKANDIAYEYGLLISAHAGEYDISLLPEDFVYSLETLK